VAQPLIQYQLNTIATLRLPTAEGSADISMARHYVQQMYPWFATLFSLHERSRDSPFNILIFMGGSCLEFERAAVQCTHT
jgi:hypothetical protein